MLWLPLTCTTRSGKEFAGLPKTIAALQERSFDFGQLLACAVSRENDTHEDHEPEHDDLDNINEEWPVAPPDPLNTVDAEWPPPPSPPPHDPLNDIDDTIPTPPKRRCSPSFDKVFTSSKKPHSGPHCRRPPKAEKLTQAERAARKSAATNARCRRR
ncbi:hypothetical protein C8F04DRAFT_1252602 [Mycena alexandri]|uniref:Uncharacterized protein n=1 Tax=Mycena alexandri TaxID=1745969 RepID=A0AAD6T8A4_9AGAR|nr:hypothetical protein C8F04DRAFT_1252602 [Mycena alexandri]